MKKIKRYFDYQRNEMTYRSSTDLNKITAECAFDLGVTKTDIITYALLMLLDTTGVCPDWSTLPDVLIDEGITPAHSRNHRRNSNRKSAVDQLFS